MPYLFILKDAFKNIEITLEGQVGSNDSRVQDFAFWVMKMHTVMPLDTLELAQQPDGSFAYVVITSDGRTWRQTIRAVSGVRHISFNLDTTTEWTIEELSTHEPLRAAMFQLINQEGATKFECSY